MKTDIVWADSKYPWSWIFFLKDDNNFLAFLTPANCKM